MEKLVFQNENGGAKIQDRDIKITKTPKISKITDIKFGKVFSWYSSRVSVFLVRNGPEIK